MRATRQCAGDRQTTVVGGLWGGAPVAPSPSAFPEFDEILLDDFRSGGPDGSVLDRAGLNAQIPRPGDIAAQPAQPDVVQGP
jgi:hypothetical protein